MEASRMNTFVFFYCFLVSGAVLIDKIKFVLVLRQTFHFFFARGLTAYLA